MRYNERMIKQAKWLVSFVLLLTLGMGQVLAFASQDCICPSSEKSQQPVLKIVKKMPCCPDANRCEKDEPCGCEMKAVSPASDNPASLQTDTFMIGIIPLNAASILNFSWKDDPASTYRHLYPDKRKSYLTHRRLLI